MRQRYIIISLIYMTCCTSAHAQFHFKGLKGVTAEYGIHNSLEKYVSAGYQHFLSNRFQFEIQAAFEEGSFLDSSAYLAYDVAAIYHTRHFMLQESIDYSILKLFNRIYLNVGVGLTQQYQQLSNTSLHSHLDSTRIDHAEEIPPFDKKEAMLKDRVSFGGHVHLLLEAYLSRHLTLLARYRYTYFTKSHYDQQVQQTTVGLRFNF